jgi:hypothetical protein
VSSWMTGTDPKLFETRSSVMLAKKRFPRPPFA